MARTKRICLVSNTASGSYSTDALDALAEAIRLAGFELCDSVCFPEQELPTVESLRGSQIDTVAIFTGDGTANSCLTRLYGWDGSVLVLPGGTMNLLAHKLHGDADAQEIVARMAAGAVRRVRRNVVRSSHGDALVGYSAGPATAWYTVREAMRESDIEQMIDEAGEALSRTMAQDAMVRVTHPDIGEPEGYPLVEIVPTEKGLRLDAYNPHTLGDYIEQGWKMLLRRFREGPHDVLGYFDEISLANVSGAPLELSIDGEMAKGEPVETVGLAQAEVDLLATSA